MKKVITLLLICSLIFIPTIFTTASAVKSNLQSGETRDLKKDETVFANLNHVGRVNDIYIVNRIETPLDGIYSDFGNYKEVINLSNGFEPIIENGKVNWQLSADPEGFYYQGILESGELPFEFNLTYRLDGKAMQPEEMIGKAGKVELTLAIESNEKSANYFKENYMAQIQVPLSLDISSNINAPSSSVVIVGRTATLGYMVMPGKDAKYNIAFNTTAFELSSFSITSMFMDMASFISVDIDTEELMTGVSKMSDGAGQLIDGTQQLKDGLTELKDGISKLAAGGKQLQGALPEIENGIKVYVGSVSDLAKSAREISSNMDQLAAQGEELSTGYAQLKTGIVTLLTQLSSNPLLPDEMKAQLAMLQQQLDAYETGLNEYISGTAMIASGMKSFSNGIAKLSSADQELLNGLSIILGGISQLTTGLTQTSKELTNMPAEVQKLIDGQVELKEGIDQSMNIFDELGVESSTQIKPVSFVSSEGIPNSVQFIMKTPELKVEKDDKTNNTVSEENNGFWHRFVELFK